MMKVSSSINEYLCSLKTLHIFNNKENEHWGFFIDIEPKKNTDIVSKNKYKCNFKPSFKNRIHSYKSVSNLEQLTNTHEYGYDYDPIFKMDEDYEEENQKYIQKQTNPSKNYKEFNVIGNICIVSSVLLFLFLI